MTATITERLQLRFDPHTIEHLGIKMYSRLPYALAELVANAYDAGAEIVSIDLRDEDSNNKQIIISDDGEGMSYDEVQDKFLVIGRKRRDFDESRNNSKGRRITGKKGVGKLALFGIGKRIEVQTTVKGVLEKTQLILEWDKIIGETSGTYYPEFEVYECDCADEHGTTLILSNLSRVTDFDLQGTAIALSKLFNWFDIDFQINISHNGMETIQLSRDLKYEGITKEFEWDVGNIVSCLDDNYEYKAELKGKIISSKKPMKPDLRGITLYVN